MVDTQVAPLGFFLADCANAPLPRQYPLVLLDGDPVAPEQVRAPVFALAGEDSCTKFRIGCVSELIAGADFRLVGGVVLVSGLQHPFSILGLLRVAFSPVLVVAFSCAFVFGQHRSCAPAHGITCDPAVRVAAMPRRRHSTRAGLARTAEHGVRSAWFDSSWLSRPSRRIATAGR